MADAPSCPAATLAQVEESLGTLLGELCAAPASCESECRAVTVQLDSSAGRFWRSWHALKKRRQDECLNVAVLALTKSGKSTLLNALVGSELLPMNNVPETARICKVVHTPNSEPYLVEPSPEVNKNNKKAVKEPTVTARGEAAVRARLQELNKAVRDKSLCRVSLPGPSRSLQTALPVTPPSSAPSSLGATSSLPSPLDTLTTRLSSSPTDEDIHMAAANSPAVAGGLPMDKVLAIHAPVAALLEYAPTGQSAAGVMGNVRLQLLDTPGPNEAGEEELRHEVERLLDGVDVALYLLDYTKLKTQDEAGMFERLRLVNPELVKRLSQRLFFVINKMDAAQTSEGQDPEVTRQYVADLVTRQMRLDGFELQPEQVLLLSARNGLLSRLVLRGNANAEAKARFVQLAFGRFANPNTIPQDQLVAAAHALLADSGLLDLEAQVLAYLYTHAAAVKHLALVDDVGRLLAEVRNVSTACAAALSASAEALSARIQEVQAQLAQTLSRFETVQQDADAIASEVAREVSAHLQTLKGRLFSAIINTLDTTNPVATNPVPGPTTATARRWQAVRERFLSVFTGRGSGGVFSSAPSNISSGASSGGGNAAGGEGVSYFRAEDDTPEGFDNATMAMLNAAGGAVARSQNKSELQRLLAQLHEDITQQIHSEVREFWGVMETVAGARHAELLATLNTTLAELSKQVEGAVSRSLEVRLSPVTLSLTPPDASQFHTDLDQLLARGLVETREKHIRVNQKTVTEKVLRHGGFCRWGEYWESVPRVKTVVEVYKLSVYELVPSEITAHFIGMIEGAVEATQSSLEAYVSQFVNTQLQEAREHLKEYCDCYLGAMTGALDASHKGTEHRLAALSQVQALLARLGDVTAMYDLLKRSTESTVPRAQEPIAYDDLADLSEECPDEMETPEETDEQLEVEEAGTSAAVVQEGEAPAAEAVQQGSTKTAQDAVVEDVTLGVPPVCTEAPVAREDGGMTGSDSASVSVVAPTSPQSVSSSVVNALLRASLTPPVAVSLPTREPAIVNTPQLHSSAPAEDAPADGGAGDMPLDAGRSSAATSASGTLVTEEGSSVGPVVSTESSTGDVPPAVSAGPAVVDPAMNGSLPRLERKSAALASLTTPFDYGQAMSSQMSSSHMTGAGEGVGGEQLEGGSSGSEDWDVVDGKEALPA